MTAWFLAFAIALIASNVQTALADKISEDRQALDKKEFAEEKAAQQHGQVITDIWDELRKLSSNYPEIAEKFVPNTLTMSAKLEFSSLWDSAFGKISFSKPGLTQSFSGDSFVRFLSDLRDEGWSLDESEFHHLAFESARASVPAHSTVSITLHTSKHDLRVILRGKVEVTWTPATKGALPKIATVDASQLSAWSRSGPLPFKAIWKFRTSDIGPGLTGRLLPLFVDDFDGDGLPEIGLGGADIWLRNQGGFRFNSTSALLSESAALSAGSAIADFNGDGQADLLAAGFMDSTLKLHLGQPKASNRPNEAPFGAGKKCFVGRLDAPQCMAVADVDGDGDLDVFVGQYKAPYQAGNMPTPFHDANDGFPSFLLINNGHGEFRDATRAAGLATKRNRRTYAASFVDFDGDSHLDLVVTSDFAGVDVYQGNGKGQFVDRTQAWLSQPHLFGMSHILSDMNRDGVVDLYAVGMASTTARRLERMQLGRETEQEITAHRAAMGYGNRLYLGAHGADKRFTLTEPEFAHDVAESGWSWGAADPDLDNNGRRDIFIANGHISGQSACDYCSTFWRHDIYTSVRREDGQDWASYFKSQLNPIAEYETSWNGYEHNVAFLQEGNGKFTNLSYLLGLSYEGDSRAVAAADIDRDGDMDLIVIALDPIKKLTHGLIVFENLLPASDNASWIGIDFGGLNAKPSPLNARVILTRQDGSVETAVVATGGAFCTQGPSMRHFGLGSDDSIKSVDVRWANGTSAHLVAPAINRWHAVKPKAKQGQTFANRIASGKLPGGPLEDLTKQPPAITVELFDGKSLAGWTGSTDAYEVHDEILASLPDKSGNLYTKAQYADFILQFEFRLTPGANNGIGIRAPLKGDAAYVGIELQVLDNSADIYAELKPYQFHGSAYGIAAAQRGQLKPVGEWNKQQVECVGRQIKVILNNHTILEVDLDEVAPQGRTLDGQAHPGMERAAGHIGLLGHGSVVEYRNLRLQDLSAEENE